MSVSLPGIDLLELERFQRLEHHEMFTRLRNEAPISWHDHPKGRGFWNVVKHEDVVTVGRQAHRFSSEIGGISILDPEEYEGGAGTGADQRGLMMLYTDPPKHTRYRLLVQKGFTPRMVNLLEQHLEAKAVAIVDNIIERGECDFVEDLAAELPLQAIAEIMGVPQEDRRLLFQWSNQLIGADDPEYARNNADGDATASMTAAMELYMYVNALAKARQADPRDDIVTRLINAEIEGDKLSELEFDMFMLLLTVAGNETTRNTTSWGMWALLNHPDELAKLKADPDTLLPGAIEEVLRWASPVYHFRRTAVHDTEVRGQEIKANDKVVIWYISANRDEDVFEDPFRFDITRSPNEQIAFGGGGPHFCLGANLARMELRLIFREILERLDDIQLAAAPSLLRSNFIGGIKQMPITFKPGPRKN